MQKLFNFLIRNHIVFLFLILQLTAFTLTINALSFQKSSYFNSSSQFFGSILNSYHEIEEFINLKQTNENLARENAQLRSASEKSFFQLYSIQDSVIDTLYHQQYVFIEAQVVSSSFTEQNNYMTINRGHRHGIEKGMGVLNANGAIGIVKFASKNFSVVVPIINTSQYTTGRIAKSRHFGSIVWDGKDFRNVQLTSVQKHAKFEIGDTIYTDVRSRAFPTGIPIGTIKSFEIEAKNQLYKLEVTLLPDFSSLEYVYVVKDLLKNELLETELKAHNEQ